MAIKRPAFMCNRHYSAKMMVMSSDTPTFDQTAPFQTRNIVVSWVVKKLYFLRNYRLNRMRRHPEVYSQIAYGKVFSAVYLIWWSRVRVWIMVRVGARVRDGVGL